VTCRRSSTSGRSRACAEGELGLLDRSSVPHRQPLRPDERRVEGIAALRRLFPWPEVAEILGMAPSTVSGILTRIGLGRSACSSRSRTRRTPWSPGRSSIRVRVSSSIPVVMKRSRCDPVRVEHAQRRPARHRPAVPPCPRSAGERPPVRSPSRSRQLAPRGIECALSIGDRRLRRFARVVDDEHGEGTCLKDVMADAPEQE
jgi:hypothetical protein